MREFASNMKPVLSLAPALRTAFAGGQFVDRLGFDALSILVTTGQFANGVHKLIVDESDYADGVGSRPVPASALTKPLPVLDAAEKANKATLIGYTGDARFIRVSCEVTGSPATGAVVGAVVLLGRARSKPAS